MIVNTSMLCDANTLSFRVLASHYGLPQFYVDVPPTQREEDLRYVADEFRELGRFLEEQLHRPLDEERLRGAMLRSKRTVELLRACLLEKKSHSLPGDLTSEMYEVYLAHNALGSLESERYAEMLLRDLKNAPPAKGLRFLWLHTMPLWQTPVRTLFDLREDCQVVSCDMCTESLTDVDPERPYESMARRLLCSPWNGGGARVKAALALAKELRVDGVVCFCHWGCKQTMGLSALFKEALEREGFPTLILNGDGCDRRNASDGQTATRLSAFLEMIGGKRHA
jgi:benzoyl-CoA reductase/2-hydroxyglutaryl-CoA dehydratase subunit BcrC/BadD/HgdB